MMPGDGHVDPPELSDRDYVSWLEEKVESLRALVEREYQRGVEEGSAAQAILEIQGRDLFMKGLRDD